VILRGSALAQRFFIYVLQYVAQGVYGVRVSAYTDGVHDVDSQHPLGTAVDLGVRTGTERSAALVILERWKNLGLYGADEGDHVHLQLFRRGQTSLP
jgi:hypothetical protein